jgi:hypothetical protein
MWFASMDNYIDAIHDKKNEKKKTWNNKPEGFFCVL